MDCIQSDRLGRTNRLINDPATIEIICDHVSNGGSLTDLCKTWDVGYNKIIRWINSQPLLLQQYTDAQIAQAEWATTRILAELRSIALVDVTKIIGDGGVLLPSTQWPDEVKAAISNIDVSISPKGTVTHKISLWNKVTALELSAKQLGLIRDRLDIRGKIEHSIKMTDEQLIDTARARGIELPPSIAERVGTPSSN